MLPLAVLAGALPPAGAAVFPDRPAFAQVEPVFSEDRRTTVFEIAMPLAADELLVVAEKGSEKTTTEAFISARRMKANYRISLRREGGEGGSFHVKCPSGDQWFKGAVAASVRAVGGVLRIELADARTHAPRGTLIWSARVEKMDDFARRHPQFTRPEDRGLFLAWSSLGRYPAQLAP